MITIKTKEEIEIIASGGHILKTVIDQLGREIKPGAKAVEIEKLAEELIIQNGGKSNFKGRDGFPSCLCFSINDEIVHGFPDKKVLKEGDIVTIDLGIFFPITKFITGEIDKKKFPNIKDGFHTDMAITYPVGNIDSEAKRLLTVTKKSLKIAINKVKPGMTFAELGGDIQKYVEKQGFNVFRDLCGHGIGAKLHEDPSVLNYKEQKMKTVIEEGMVFCIEPMVAMGDYTTKIDSNGFTYLTKDGSLSAHFEDMIAVTKHGGRVLTE